MLFSIGNGGPIQPLGEVRKFLCPATMKQNCLIGIFTVKLSIIILPRYTVVCLSSSQSNSNNNTITALLLEIYLKTNDDPNWVYLTYCRPSDLWWAGSLSHDFKIWPITIQLAQWTHPFWL